MKNRHMLFLLFFILLFTVAICICLSNNLQSATKLDPNAPLHPSAGINLNTATFEELTMIPGIGENLANNIIAYRQQNGPFHSVEELMHVKGFGKSTYEEVSRFLSVGGK